MLILLYFSCNHYFDLKETVDTPNDMYLNVFVSYLKIKTLPGQKTRKYLLTILISHLETRHRNTEIVLDYILHGDLCL